VFFPVTFLASLLLFNSRTLTAEEDVHVVTTLAGVAESGSTNGMGTNSKFSIPYGITISPDGALAFVVDRGNHVIRQMIISTASVTTLAGEAGSFGSANGIGTTSRFNAPHGITVSPDGVYVLITEKGNHLIRRIIISTASVTTFAGATESSGSTNGVGTNSQFNVPVGVAISPDGEYALIADRSNDLIRQIIISTASVTTFAGVTESSGSTNGVGTNSQFFGPCGIAISPNGEYALVAGNSDNLIRLIIISTASVTTLAGDAGDGFANGIGSNSKFYRLNLLSISPDGEYALVADQNNNLIRQIIISTASVLTLAGVAGTPGSANGIGTNSQFSDPFGIAISPNGESVLVGDSGNNLIRRISMDPPTRQPSCAPTSQPSGAPTSQPSGAPTSQPSGAPTSQPSGAPTSQPSGAPTSQPSGAPTSQPSGAPTSQPSGAPTSQPSGAPTSQPSGAPTSQPSGAPTSQPSGAPTSQPSGIASVTYSFGVAFGDHGILTADKAILVDFARDVRKRE
jgi:DNA-binding beta-propeller fold protein YncE